jgi:hypothetical protein
VEQFTLTLQQKSAAGVALTEVRKAQPISFGVWSGSETVPVFPGMDKAQPNLSFN